MSVLKETTKPKYKTSHPTLHEAAAQGDKAKVAELLQARASVNAQNTKGETALFIAAQYDQEEIIDSLLAANANYNLTRTDGASPLIISASQDRPGAIKKLLHAQANVHAITREGATALFIAAQFGRSKETIALLLSARANIEHRLPTNGSSPLIAAAQNGHTLTVSQLLEAGADINYQRDYGETPLWMATFNLHASTVTFLLEKKASQIARHDGITPLAIATKIRPDAKIAKLLTQATNASSNTSSVAADIPTPAPHIDESPTPTKKAKENKKKKEGQKKRNKLKKEITRTSITLNSNLIIASEQGNDTEIRQLLEKKADIDYCTPEGTTALSIAAHHGHIKTVNLLLEKNAKHQLAREHDGAQPLHFAVKAGHKEIVHSLLQAQANPNVPIIHNIFPLHTAAYNGNKEIINALLDAKANPHVAGTDDQVTALYMAEQEGHEEIAEILGKSMLHQKADQKKAATYKMIRNEPGSPNFFASSSAESPAKPISNPTKTPASESRMQNHFS